MEPEQSINGMPGAHSLECVSRLVRVCVCVCVSAEEVEPQERQRETACVGVEGYSNHAS